LADEEDRTVKKSSQIPSGLDHLKMLTQLEASTVEESSKHLAESNTELRMIGTAMSALYQAATCHRKCHGGAHVFEALCARMYNLAVGAYLLAMRGLYDEALSLTRSIGEVSNLVALSVVDKAALTEWLSSDKKSRLRKFSPSEVRKALERKEPSLLLANEDWYARFCEKYTHITPQTKPNMHNAELKGFAGGVYQVQGLEVTLSELATVLGAVSLIVCRYFKFSDLFDEISAIVNSTQDESRHSVAPLTRVSK
jgi:hypothetical protein